MKNLRLMYFAAKPPKWTSSNLHVSYDLDRANSRADSHD